MARASSTPIIGIRASPIRVGTTELNSGSSEIQYHGVRTVVSSPLIFTCGPSETHQKKTSVAVSARPDAWRTSITPTPISTYSSGTPKNVFCSEPLEASPYAVAGEPSTDSRAYALTAYRSVPNSCTPSGSPWYADGPKNCQYNGYASTT